MLVKALGLKSYLFEVEKESKLGAKESGNWSWAEPGVT